MSSMVSMATKIGSPNASTLPFTGAAPPPSCLHSVMRSAAAAANGWGSSSVTGDLSSNVVPFRHSSSQAPHPQAHHHHHHQVRLTFTWLLLSW